MITTNTGYEIYFASGRFDSWCVYLNNTDNKKTIPLDKDYFLWLLDLASKYSKQQVYDDFLKVYESVDENLTKMSVLNCVMKLISTTKKILLTGG